jgi:hypothetical protein
MRRSQVEQRIILISASTEARRLSLQDTAQRSMAQVDWPSLAERLRSRRLLSILGPRIAEMQDGPGDAGFSDAVERATDAGRLQGAFLQLVAQRVVAALAAEGIASAPLKGPMLSERLYGDPGRRVSTDIDLLISPSQLSRAVDVVRGLGYRPPSDHLEPDGLPLLHFALVHERNELPPVELHWRVHWYERNFAHERLLPADERPTAGWRADPAAELVALLLFYARDGFLGLRLATDLATWWDAFGGELMPERVDELLRAYPALGRVIPAAAQAAERVVGVPAAQIVTQMPKFSVRERMAIRLADPNPESSTSQIYADMGLIDGLLAPRGGLSAFMRRQVLLPREVVDERARGASKRRPRSSVIRGLGILGRYGLTTTRLMRPQDNLR